MPSLKEIKNRIASVNSTRKITSAMKMVASSKLHHAQVAIENMLPYENLLEHILKAFLVSTPDTNTSFSEEREIKRVALLVFSSNSSLCGGFNTNIIKMLQSTLNDYLAKGVTKDNIIVYPIGRKVAEKVAKMGLKSAGSQILTRKTYLPIDLDTELSIDKERDLTSNITTKKAQEYLKAHKRNMQSNDKDEIIKPLNDDFIVEPDLKTVLTSLIPKLLHLMVYTALLDNNASEHAARMVAMQSATDNADELLRGLKLQYNKSRQAAITSELLDIVGGSINN